MNIQQSKIITWWHTGRDYHRGVLLFAAISKNKTLIHYFKKKTEKFGRSKLEYQLPKAAGLYYKNMPLPSTVEQKPLQTQQNKTTGKTKAKTVKPLLQTPEKTPYKTQINTETAKDYPQVIRRLKYEYSDLYNKRSILHKRMGLVNPENSPENITTRSVLLKEIQKTTGQMEFLHPFIEAFETKGVIPLTEQVWPPKKAEQLPMDPVKLKKIKKNLQSSNTKDKNLLLYQKMQKQKTENPIPAGPKKQKLELRIKKREIEITKIDQQLFDIQYAD
jgi:hypothetical protein